MKQIDINYLFNVTEKIAEVGFEAGGLSDSRNNTLSLMPPSYRRESFQNRIIKNLSTKKFYHLVLASYKNKKQGEPERRKINVQIDSDTFDKCFQKYLQW